MALLPTLDSTPEKCIVIAYLCKTRNIALEEDLCDQLFNHSGKKAGAGALKLSRLGNQSATPDVEIAQVSHGILAEMIGTTRPRVAHFMNKFRKLGLIDYNKTDARAALLTDVVLTRSTPSEPRASME